MQNKLIKEVNLLIVDDDVENIRAIGRCLPSGYHYKGAQNGVEAIRMLTECDEIPDLILLDMMMPFMGGMEVCKRIKADKRLSMIPIIFLSGATESIQKIRALSIGAVDYVTKPFNYTEVLARIDLHLQLVSLRNALKNSNQELEVLIEEKVSDISKLQMETIFALVCLVGSRDDFTDDHIRRLQLMCGILASKLKEMPKYQYIIDALFVHQLYNTSPLYDIGKISIPDAILLKPGELTTEESEIVKRHTLIGADTLNDVKCKHPDNCFITMGIEIALSHHEKWDGTGYPNGLMAEEIPLSAQIVSLIEQFNALLSKRPYKGALSFDDAVQTIISCRNSSFNPDLVDAFSEIQADLKRRFYT